MARPKKNSQPSSPHKKIINVPGVIDLVPDTNPLWEIVLKRFTAFARSYGFSAVYPPIIEDQQLYEVLGLSGIENRRLVIADTGTKRAVLRTSMLPGILRAYHGAKTIESRPLVKWAYFGQVVAGDHKGNFVSDVEYGFEVLGYFSHLTEAQVLGAVWEMLLSLGLETITFEINNTGTEDSQGIYSRVLGDYLKGKKYDLCDACVGHLSGWILNVLRCNELDCQAILAEAPTILDFLDADSRKHFTNILEALEELQIPYQLNPLYSGTSGTNGTCCVVKYKGKNETVVLGEAAFHDGLMQKVTGKPYAAFGFLGSMDKLVSIMARAAIEVQREQKNEVYLVPLGELAAKKSLRLFKDLIAARITVYDHFGNVGVKSQLKAAQDSKSPIALIMGQKEAMDEMVILRDVKSGMQEMFHYDKIVDEVKKRLGK